MELLTKEQLARLPKRTQREYIETLEALRYKQSRRKIDTYYPEGGRLSRKNYSKHMASFYAGKKYRVRGIISGNRTGKTEGIGAIETAFHMTGEYPDWWPGYRFEEPISAWAAGDTGKTVRDIIQFKLLGHWGNFGTGMIPGDAIEGWTTKHGLPEAVDTVAVKSKFGGLSTLGLKSYDQRRESFQGTEKHWIWLDEESDEGIFSECVTRTMATGRFGGGLVLCTFTPLLGVSEVVKGFYPSVEEGTYH